ncbi:MAG: hypothetical protein C0620_10850 [Desulfuromonas sp.]|nr:MAG: hypothetical protein C0620_10850 [Desulfuromonas sp.]
MSIKHITGVPGTGKTYYAIKQVILRYYRWNDDLFEWEINPEKTKKPVLIYTNIDTLKLPHINIEHYCEERGITVYEFFTTEYWENNVPYHDYQIVVILDEAQKFYPSSYRLHGSPPPGQNTLFWFQYHRHFGPDVYIITQTYDAVCRHVVQLAEYEIHAKSKVLTLGNQFVYVYRTGLGPDAIVGGKKYTYEKKVGMLYQSFQSESDDSTRPNPLKKYIAITAALAVLAIVLLYRSLTSIGQPAEAEAAHRVKDEGGTASAVVQPMPKKQPPKQPRRMIVYNASDLPEPELDDKQIIVATGGLWMSGKLKAIEFYGDLISVKKFDFPYTTDGDQVLMQLPESLLNSLQIAKNDRYYQDTEGQWHDMTPQADVERDPINTKGFKVSNPRKEADDRRRQRNGDYGDLLPLPKD